eukprot:TRINITY_DN15287_c0_g1_i1.p1 TRINITY_DN15287_c0_g1~~TRINITY_DN15287_c0_g1_i1.p1  ORF type:complete len:581 (+),score=89.47 TRINITY_DN15287_c0_g1_i1:99-1841(+)
MIDYDESCIVYLIFRRHGSVFPRAAIFAVPASVLSFFIVVVLEYFPDLYAALNQSIGLGLADKSMLWSGTTAVVGILLGFRTNRAMARFWEGTGLLHQMRGEWFDSVSCCVTFSSAAVAQRSREVTEFRHTIVRLMSLCHGSALEEIAGVKTELLETIDSGGLNGPTLTHLNACAKVYQFNRVEVILHLMQNLITSGLTDGIIQVPPPILSRVYQTLSRGFVNLLNAKKITDTRFPFPFAQLITAILLAHLLLTPMIVAAVVPNKVLAPLFTFFPIFGMYSLNFIAVELENPFGQDANDLPLEHFQTDMNRCLLMLLYEGSDLVAGIDHCRAQVRFDELTEVRKPNGSVLRFPSNTSTDLEKPLREAAEAMAIDRELMCLPELILEDTDGYTVPHKSYRFKDAALGDPLRQQPLETIPQKAVPKDVALGDPLRQQPLETIPQKDVALGDPLRQQPLETIPQKDALDEPLRQPPLEATRQKTIPKAKSSGKPIKAVSSDLTGSMEDFHEALLKWTQTIQSQLGAIGGVLQQERKENDHSSVTALSPSDAEKSSAAFRVSFNLNSGSETDSANEPVVSGRSW